MRLSNDDLQFIADSLLVKKQEAEAGLVTAAEAMDLESIRRYSENLANVETIMQKINKRLNPVPKANTAEVDATVEGVSDAQVA